jgi:hypothetical protein
MSNRFEKIFLKCLEENSVVSALGAGAQMDGVFSGASVWNPGDQRLANYIGTDKFVGDDVSKKKAKRSKKSRKRSKKKRKTKKESTGIPIQRRNLNNSM